MRAEGLLFSSRCRFGAVGLCLSPASRPSLSSLSSSSGVLARFCLPLELSGALPAKSLGSASTWPIDTGCFRAVRWRGTAFEVTGSEVPPAVKRRRLSPFLRQSSAASVSSSRGRFRLPPLGCILPSTTRSSVLVLVPELFVPRRFCNCNIRAWQRSTSSFNRAPRSMSGTPGRKPGRCRLKPGCREYQSGSGQSSGPILTIALYCV